MRRSPFGWWLGLLALAGCASAFQPMGPALQVPVLEPGAVITADGYRLPLRVWRPEGQVVAVLLALHGFNDYSDAFANVGPVLARHGILTYAYDQRGFGATARPGVWPGTRTLVADLETVAGLLIARHPDLPFSILGESMGGAVAMVALTDPGLSGSPLSKAESVVLVAPAVWGREAMGLVPRLALAVTRTLVPGLALTSPRELNIHASDNDEMLRGLGRDKLVIKATRVDTVNGLVGLMGSALESAPRFRTPALILYGAHEEVLPGVAIYRMLAELPAGPRRVAVYPNGWHMLLRDRQGYVVVDDIAAWLRNPSAALPSGADRQPLPQIGSR